MSSAKGIATVNFGSGVGSNETSIAVTGQTFILATSKVDAYVMGDDSTSDHSASDHRYFDLLAGLTCGTPTAGVGFTIYAVSGEKLTGTYQVQWVWVD